jgi:chemotaxis-related protein WspB
MLVLPLEASSQQFGVPCREILEVVPAVSLRTVPHAPAWVAGLFPYRGVVTPVVDLGVLLGGSAAVKRLSTRILVVRLEEERRVGIRAEKVAEPIDIDDEKKGAALLHIEGAPFLGEVVTTSGGALIQLLYPKRILQEEHLDVLFGEREA